MPKCAPSSSSGSLVPGVSACSMMAWLSARHANSTREDFLLIQATPPNISHTINRNVVHKTRIFWSRRTNCPQPVA